MKNLFNNFVIRRMINEYFGANSKVKFRKPSNGTVRFQVEYITPTGVKLGEQGFYRIRERKFIDASGTAPDHKGSFNQIHFGKYTVGVENPKGRQVWNFAYSAESE